MFRLLDTWVLGYMLLGQSEIHVYGLFLIHLITWLSNPPLLHGRPGSAWVVHASWVLVVFVTCVLCYLDSLPNSPNYLSNSLAPQETWRGHGEKEKALVQLLPIERGVQPGMFWGGGFAKNIAVMLHVGVNKYSYHLIINNYSGQARWMLINSTFKTGDTHFGKLVG